MSIVSPTLSVTKTFLADYWKWLIALAVTAALCLLLGYCEGKHAGRAAEQLDQANAVIDDMENEATADEIAGEERAVDTRRLTERERNLRDAINEVDEPGARPSAHSAALNCQRLRNDGWSEEKLPAECRRESSGGTEAAADGSDRHR